MEYNRLGKSEITISAIGLGCMSLKQHVADREKIIHTAVDSGINYFDTADLYENGENEIMLGKALYGKRQKLILATKVGNEWLPDGKSWRWNTSKSYILKAAENSLRRLQTDYLDLYQLHGGTQEDNMDEILEAFSILQQQGKIRYYGISSIRPAVIRKYVQNASIVSNMLQYSLLDRRPEEEIIPLLNNNHIAVLVRGALAQGLLVNKPAKDYLDYSTAQVQTIQKKAALISPLSATPTALKFILQQKPVTAAIIGVSTIQQLNDILAAAGSTNLNHTIINELANILPLTYYQQHR